MLDSGDKIKVDQSHLETVNLPLVSLGGEGEGCGGVVKMLDSGDKIKVDQSHLETVIHAIGKEGVFPVLFLTK